MILESILFGANGEIIMGLLRWIAVILFSASSLILGIVIGALAQKAGIIQKLPFIGKMFEPKTPAK
jgi:hypothetical protein